MPLQQGRAGGQGGSCKGFSGGLTRSRTSWHMAGVTNSQGVSGPTAVSQWLNNKGSGEQGISAYKQWVRRGPGPVVIGHPMGSKTCSAPLAYTPADESASGAVVLISTALQLPLLLTHCQPSPRAPAAG